VAIVFGYLGALICFITFGNISSTVLLALGVAGAGVALLGFLDDHGHIAARWRLLGHFGAAFWVLYWLGGFPPIVLFGEVFDLGWLGYGLGALYLVWLLNLYNFMDGIDGIASVEAICVCVGGALLVAFGPAQGAVFWLPLALAACVAGFLIWNFPPAKIFMGDAGSGFLGLMLGALSLHAAWAEPAWLWSWLILLGVFIVDATFTLARRLLRGDKVYEAHRSHAYQYASRHYGRHLPVTMAVLVTNLIWLLPLALCVGAGVVDGVLGLIIAYVPLVALAVRFRAGELEVAK
jgi:Fuc2NAc and GlcNAc transferase